MQKFTVSVFINRPQQDVFDFLSNPVNFERWMPLMQSAAWTSSGEPGVGTTGRGIMKMAGREMALLLEVTRWDVPGRLGFKILNNPFPLEAMEYVYRLEPEDSGTRLTLDGEVEMFRLLRFAGGLMGKMYVRSNRNELNTAKQLLEGGQQMDAFELSIMINRPIDEAFAVLANLENDVKWHSAFVEARNTSGGSLGVGARFLVFEGIRGRRAPGTEYEVTEYEPNRVAAWKTVSGPLQLKFWRTFERVDGGTQFAVRYEGAPRGILTLAWPLITRMAKRQQGGDMGKLKQLMEAHAL